MSTDLSTLIEPLKRELAVPGEYDTYFPNTGDDDLTGSLSDAFAEAQLDGFFGTYTCDVDLATVTPDLSAAGGAVLVLYAGTRTLRGQIRNLKLKVLYKAGPVEYDVQQSANVLTELLREMDNRRKELLRIALKASRSTNAVHVTDGYLIRAAGYVSSLGYGDYSGFFAGELTSSTWE